MVKIVIVDDEKHCTDILQVLIDKNYPEYNIIGCFNSALEALDFINNHSFDLLFLDIQMPELTGFMLLDKLDEIAFDVVFTTAFDQYAIKAFKYSAFSYLLKPITEKNLVEVVNDWGKKKSKIKEEQWQLLKEFVGQPSYKADKIALPSSHGLEIIHINKILRCRSENNYTVFHIEGGEQLIVSRSLKEVEEILSAHAFIRIHQSHIINTTCIKSISRKEGGFVLMCDGSEVPVSRQKKEMLDKLLENMVFFK